MRLKLGKVNIVSGVLHALDIIPQEEIKSLRNGLRALTHLLKQGIFSFLFFSFLYLLIFCGSLSFLFSVAVNRKRFVSSEHMLTFVMYFLDKISRDRDTVLLFLEICRRLVKGGVELEEFRCVDCGVNMLFFYSCVDEGVIASSESLGASPSMCRHLLRRPLHQGQGGAAHRQSLSALQYYGI